MRTVNIKLKSAQSTGSWNLNLKLLFLVTIRLSLFSFPLELEVRPVVVPGLPAGQHHPGVHQDTEEDSFLSRFRSPDDSAIQCC